MLRISAAIKRHYDVQFCFFWEIDAIFLVATHRHGYWRSITLMEEETSIAELGGHVIGCSCFAQC